MLFHPRTNELELEPVNLAFNARDSLYLRQILAGGSQTPR
jgi:hypothetical protein